MYPSDNDKFAEYVELTNLCSTVCNLRIDLAEIANYKVCVSDCFYQ